MTQLDRIEEMLEALIVAQFGSIRLDEMKERWAFEASRAAQEILDQRQTPIRDFFDPFRKGGTA